MDGTVTRSGSAATTEVKIESIAAGGEGVGHLDDGRAIFVGRTAPGELVEVEIEREKKLWARGRALRILESSPVRRLAPCPNHSRCGGCTIEHLAYAAQLEAKARIVRDALQRIGGLELDIPDIVPSPAEFHYRNRVSFTLRRLPGQRVVAGFHGVDSPRHVVDIDGSCMLPESPIGTVWDRIRSVWGAGAVLLPKGSVLRLTLRATASGEVSLLVGGGEGTGSPTELLDAVDGLESIWIQPEGEGARLVAGEPTLLERWNGEEIALAGAAFLQVNRQTAALLDGYVAELARGHGDDATAIDAYCGVGIHARRLAEQGFRVSGIELDPDAVRAARELGGVEYLEGRVEDRLPELLPADLLLLNPPRNGLAPEVTERIAEEPPAQVIYISCNPATLARDVQLVAGQFDVGRVRCFDMFPQTAHVETVLELVRS